MNSPTPAPFCPVKWKWRKRLQAEIAAAEKTFTVRLSFRPRGKTDLHSLAALKREYPEVQKWLKRVRKNHGKAFRYSVIGELGSHNHRIHYHVQIHGSDLTQAAFRNAWKQGHTHAKTVDKQYAVYLSKYLGKDEWTPKASKSYGRHAVEQLRKEAYAHPLVQSVMEHFPGAKIKRLAYGSDQYRGTLGLPNDHARMHLTDHMVPLGEPDDRDEIPASQVRVLRAWPEIRRLRLHGTLDAKR